MTLESLEPRFVMIDGAGWRPVDTLGEAQGIECTCPSCRSHPLLAWFRGRGVPDGLEPGPGRWTLSGTGYGDLTLAPSINVRCWHGFVRGGRVTNA